MLSFRNVTKSFRLGGETVITPVRDVSLTIESGEFIVIIGRSGSGKTTLLNLAAGLVKPSAGYVLIDNRDLAVMTDRQISSLRCQKIGFIFQFPSLLPALTVRDNISLPGIFTERNGNKNIEDQALTLIDMLGLVGKADVYPRHLSAGETKRVVIARSLINRPQLVLADEPTSDLDSRTEEEVMAVLRDLNSRGVTFLIVSHNLQLVNFATRAFEMENGNLKLVTAASTPVN